MTTWQSNDDVRRNGGAEVAEFDDAPPMPTRPDEAQEDEGVEVVPQAATDGEHADGDGADGDDAARPQWPGPTA